MQDATPLLVGRELYGCVGHDPGHRGRVPPPQGQNALVGIGVLQVEQRGAEREGNIVADLEVYLGAVQRGDDRLGQRPRRRSRYQADYHLVDFLAH